MLEDEVRDVSLAVDDEAVDVSEVLTVRRGHVPCGADLYFALRHAVVADRDMRVRVDRLHPDAHPVDALVVRQRKLSSIPTSQSGSSTENSPSRR